MSPTGARRRDGPPHESVGVSRRRETPAEGGGERRPDVAGGAVSTSAGDAVVAAVLRSPTADPERRGDRGATDVEQVLWRRLTDKRMRKSALTPGVVVTTRRAVAEAVGRSRPLRLIVPFGGYKSPASPEHPWVGWAEVFAVDGLCRFAAPICAVHPPGVVIELSSDAPIAGRLTGAPRDQRARYRRDFERVVAQIADRYPSNLHVVVTSLADYYDVEALEAAVRTRGRTTSRAWFGRLSVEERRALVARAAANRARGVLRPGTRARLERSVREHHAFHEIDDEQRHEVLFGAATVPIALRRGLEGWLHLGSNHRSATQFWVGCGFVGSSRGGPAAHILPPTRARAVVPTAVELPVSWPALSGPMRVLVAPEVLTGGIGGVLNVAGADPGPEGGSHDS